MKLPTVWAAIDFETADGFSAQGRPSHACAVGLVVVVRRRVVAVRGRLIRPSVPFSPAATKVHGLGPGDVSDAPPFSTVWSELLDICDHHGVEAFVAHNFAFDENVAAEECKRAGREMVPHPWFCSQRAAKWAWPKLPSFSLSAVCEVLGLPLQHHQAVSDAVAAGLVQLAALRVADVLGPRPEHDRALEVALSFAAGVASIDALRVSL